MKAPLFDSDHWFTEVDAKGRSAFSLQVKKKLHSETTPFQTIEIFDTHFYGNLMTIDGFIMLTEKDNFLYHEMMAHPILFTHSDPESVVIIGGGDCGTLKEVLKHPTVKQVTQIEIDEVVTRLSKEYFPSLCENNSDPRATLLFEDGIAWMANAPENSVDVIIVDSTDPFGSAEGLFTEGFYRSCARVLKEKGLLIHQSESPLYHGSLQADMVAAMKAGGLTETHPLFFPQPVYPSGWWSGMLASKGVPLDDFREQDAGQKAFPTQYYNVAIHRGALALPTFMVESKRTSHEGRGA